MIRSAKSSYMMPSRPPVATGIFLITARVLRSNIVTVESPPLVATQPCRGLVDAGDVRPHGLAVRTPGHDEVKVVGARALQVVDHQVAPVCLDRRFKTLDGREQVHQILGTLGAGHRDAAVPQSSRDVRHRCRTLLSFFVVLLHTPTLLPTVLAAARRRASWRRPALRGDGR